MERPPESKGPLAQERGCYGDIYFQAKYKSRLDQICTSDSSTTDNLFNAYFLYLCSRKLRLIRLAGGDNLEGIRAYLEHAAVVLLEMIGPEGWGTARHSSQAQARVSIGHEHMSTDYARAFKLGYNNKSELGVRTVLGTSTSEATPRLDIEVVVHLYEWEALMQQPGALVNLMEACDYAVPLNLNFRIHFSIHADDGVFVLSPRSKSAEHGVIQPFLGVNSVLGRA
jgi:hypothetical protein